MCLSQLLPVSEQKAVLKKLKSPIKAWKVFSAWGGKVRSSYFSSYLWRPGRNASRGRRKRISCSYLPNDKYNLGFHVCKTKKATKEWLRFRGDIVVPVYLYKKHITNIGIQSDKNSYGITFIASQATVRKADYKQAIAKVGK